IHLPVYYFHSSFLLLFTLFSLLYALPILRYVEERTDGFRILVRESSTPGSSSYSTLLNDATTNVTYILEEEFVARGFDPGTTAIYAQALVGMVSGTAQWWLEIGRASCRD